VSKTIFILHTLHTLVSIFKQKTGEYNMKTETTKKYNI